MLSKRYESTDVDRRTWLHAVIGKRFLTNGPFSAFFDDFEIFNGPFLIILHRLLWAIFQVNGTMAHGPLPSQSLYMCPRGLSGPPAPTHQVVEI